METPSEEPVLKSRSARHCISTGYRLYIGHFRRIFRATWPAALVASLLSGLIGTWHANLQMQSQPGLTTAMAVVALLTVLVSVTFYAQAMTLLCHHREQGVVPRVARMFTIDGAVLRRTFICALTCGIIWLVIISLATSVSVYAMINQSKVWLAAAVLLPLALLLLLLPLSYPAVRYLTTRQTNLFALVKTDFGKGFSHYGLLFCVGLITPIFSAMAVAVACLPAIILMVANATAVAGNLAGDPIGMPAHMPNLVGCVFTLASFFQHYIMLSAFFPFYYTSGSIEAQEQERNEKKNSIY